ncbi:MAG: alpha/beta hydrolase [Acetobacteraceae bacterium]|nr:alpha/beta hydrolase [Acetobacteraceae bacterium]
MQVVNLEAEYNNRAKVPEHPAIMERWQADARAFREAHPSAELDVSYGPSPRQMLDLFWPAADREAPLALFIHGGYWQSLDRAMFSHVAAGMLARGIAVALPSYDLCPQVSLAALVEQLRAAVAFLADRYHRGLLATGHSAGGHLAAMLLATDWRSRGMSEHTVRAAMPISGLFDLAPLLATSINDKLGLDKAEAERLSPVTMPAPEGRLHAFVGGDEGSEYERQSRAIAAAWNGTWQAIPGANHFTVLDGLLDPDSPMVRTAARLLTS